MVEYQIHILNVEGSIPSPINFFKSEIKMIGYKYKITISLNNKKLVFKLNYLNKWLKKTYGIRFFRLNLKKKVVTILKSPHVNKKAMEQLKTIIIKYIYFFQNKLMVFKCFKFFAFFLIFFEYFSRFIWYQKQGIFYLK